MFLKKKKQIISTIDTICELIEYISKSNDIKLLEDVELAIKLILKIVKTEDYDIDETINYINSSIETVEKLKLAGENITFDDLNELLGQVSIFEQAFLIQVQVKLNIAFFPYNITMWDSLESIYDAAKEDEDCVVKVVPIPYFDITQDPPVCHYDFDKYDESIGVIDFREYDLETEQPDIVYVHNIYDNGNTLTTVLPDYYTENLKKYTDMLVYSPYCIPSFLKQFTGGNKHSYTFDLTGRDNVDRFVSAGDFVVKEGLHSNIPKEKILNLGSPKFDSLIKHINEDFDYPKSWIEKSKGKKIALYTTSINFFVKQLDGDENRVTNFCEVVAKFSMILQQFRDEDIMVIWRPHPLTREFINRVNPEFVTWYDNLRDKIRGDKVNTAYENEYDNVVLDESPSFLPAFKFSDSFILDYSSIMFAYLMLNKKIILPVSEAFMNKAIDVEKYRYKIGFAGNTRKIDIKEFVNFEKADKFNLDTELLSKFYKNLDGTAGLKIHKAVKNDVLN